MRRAPAFLHALAPSLSPAARPRHLCRPAPSPSFLSARASMKPANGSPMAPQSPTSSAAPPSPPASPTLSAATTTGTSDVGSAAAPGASDFGSTVATTGASDFGSTSATTATSARTATTASTSEFGSMAAAAAGMSDLGSVVDELDGEVEDVLARISALTTDGEVGVAPEVRMKGEETVAVGAPRRVRVVYSERFLEHESPRGGHPECPERLQVIVEALRGDEKLEGLLEWVEPTPVGEGSERRALVLGLIDEVHTFQEYVDDVKKMSAGNGGFLDNDTYVAKGSYEIALLAISAWIDAVDHALDENDGGPAWALARPPGHHATRVSGMGFCLFANAGIAAQYALRRDSVSHVGVIDYDVHHGNGSEHCFREKPEVRFVSSHESPLYPYTGKSAFTGPHGNIMNVELPAGTEIGTYRGIFTDKMIPHALQDSPELVIVSSGFDALDVDPLASLEFKPRDFGEFSRLIMAAAESAGESALGKTPGVILGLEGGYNLEENGISAAAVHATRGIANV